MHDLHIVRGVRAFGVCENNGNSCSPADIRHLPIKDRDTPIDYIQRPTAEHCVKNGHKWFFSKTSTQNTPGLKTFQK
jgi:hypothetical protein